jgi:hypothetical protein
MVDVFISYARSNQPLVRQLAEAVRRLGYGVWWDDELPPHLSYSDVITDKIGAAKAAIVVWSEAAASSEWVRAEADVARAQKKLIQTSIDGRMPPMPFNQIQFAAIGDWRGEDDHPGWQKVKASLEALCGPPGEARPPLISQPPPVRPIPPQAGRGALLVPALLGLLLLAVLIVAYLLWSQGARETPPPPIQAVAPVAPAPPAPSAKPPAQPAPAPQPTLRPEASPHRPAAPRPAQAPAAAPAQAPKPEAAAAPQVLTMPFNPRRYCAGPGRGTAECEQLRERFGRQPRFRGR